MEENKGYKVEEMKARNKGGRKVRRGKGKIEEGREVRIKKRRK